MSDPFKLYSNRTYRQDIQGVRALGAALIMVYHIWLNKVSGGVDVFFVVSGFFMANMLLSQIAAKGRVQPFVFWGKIISRVAPSAYTVLVATLLLGFVFIPETQWVGLVNEVIISAFHVENLHLMRSAVDYLAREEPPSAVQQFWALSIQMQFYFALPIIFMLAAKVSILLRSLSPLILTVCGVILVSFAYSVYSTFESPESAYFSPATRIWEFFLGVLVAVLLPYLSLGSVTRNILGLLGLAVLLSSGWLIPREANFPGYVALLPVGAAACLIISGSGKTQTFISRLLCSRFLAFLGGISFTIYLWHWPLLVFYLEFTGAEEVSAPGGLLIIASSVGLAFLTKRLIEDPFKKSTDEKEHPLAPYRLGAAFFAVTLVVAGASKLHFDEILRTRSSEERIYMREPSVRVQTSAEDVSYAQFLSAKSELPQPYQDGCHQKTHISKPLVCTYGDTASDVVVALVGGSHATQWLPALDTIGKKLNLKVLNITKSHCPFGALPGSHKSCFKWNRRALEYLAKAKPAVVITNSTRASKAGVEEYVPDAYVRQWKALAESGIPVIGIRDNPQFRSDAVHCLVRNKETPLVCSARRDEALQSEDPAKPIAQKMSNLELVDMSDYFCTDDICPTVFNDMLMYRDKEHISVPYVNFLTYKLLGQLEEAAPEVFMPK